MKKLFVFFLLVFALSACGGKEVVKQSDEGLRTSRALESLEGMRQAYIARDLVGVFRYVSDDFKYGYPEFQSGLKQDLETYPKADISFEVDRIIVTDASTKVVFHWSGSWTDKNGIIRDARGNSTFIFKPSGNPAMIQSMTGDAPLGVAR